MLSSSARAPLDLEALRAAFPLLRRQIDGQTIVYLDSAATSLTPSSVIAAEARYYEALGANIHRGKHTLSEESSDAFEQARRTIARFIGARPRELIFTANATAAINLVALGLELPPGSNVVSSAQDHHSNLLPWLNQRDLELRLAPVAEDGLIDPGRLFDLVDARTRLLAVGHASNATGAIQDIAAIAAEARARGLPLLLDAAQSAPHLPLDVEALGCDYLCFSGHKMLGPTGIGVLWARGETLEALRPASLGGGTISSIGGDGFVLKPLPYRLEPGTPNIAGALGLAAAIDFLDGQGWPRIRAHEGALALRLQERLQELPGARLLGPDAPDRRLAIASIAIDSRTLSADHVAMVLSDRYKIMTRSGHHCCHPYFDGLGLSGAVRASAYLYNTIDEIDAFADALRAVLGTLNA